MSLNRSEIAGDEFPLNDSGLRDGGNSFDNDANNDIGIAAGGDGDNARLLTSTVDVAEDGEELELTVEDVVERIGQGRFQWKTMFVAGSTWVADGLELVVQSMLGGALACDWQITAAEQTMVFVFVFVFMFVGSSLFGVLADRFGRRRVCLLAILVTFVFGALSAFSVNIVMMYITRGLCAFGIGGVHLAITMFAELSPSKSRARGILLLELFWAAGTVLASLLALFLMPVLGWRWLLGAASLPIAVSFGLVWWMPESPRWLARRNRIEEARAILLDAARLNRVTLPPFRLVSKSDTHRVPDRPARVHIARLFHPVLRRVTLTLWLIWICSVVAYYGIVLLTTSVFEAEARGVRCGDPSAMTSVMESAAMMTSVNSTATAGAAGPTYAPCVRLSQRDYISIMIESAFEVPGILITIFLIDRLGRRRTAAIEYLVMGVCLLIMIPCLGRVVETGVLAVARAMIIGAFQIAYISTTESFPLDVRATALGTAMSVSRVGAVAAPFLAQYLAAESLLATFIVFSSLCFIAGGAWMSLPYETGTRLFESIADLKAYLDSRNNNRAAAAGGMVELESMSSR